MNIFLIVVMLPVVPVMYFIMRNEVKPKKNLVLGVTLPYLEREAPAVRDICARYKRALGLVTLLLIALVIPCFFMKSFAVLMTWLMTWMVAVIVAIPAVFVVYRRKLMRYKLQHVKIEPAPTVRVVDLSAVDLKTREIHATWFLPPVIIGALPAFFLWTEDTYLALTAGITGVAVSVLFYFIYRLIFRQRAELVDERTDVTIALTRIRRYNYGIFCVLSSWLSAVFNLLFWLWLDNGLLAMIATAVYIVLLLVLTLYAELKTRGLQERLTAAEKQSFYVDNDRYWLGGLVYYNPNDRKTLVNDRTGIGMSLNMARPAGLIMMSFSMLIILAMPFMGIWMFQIERTPPALRLEDGVLIAAQTKSFMELPLEEIDSVELLESLPSMRRVSGTGMETVLTGHFRSDEYGSLTVCLDPTIAPFLLLQSGDTRYIVSDRDASVTEKIYSQLSTALR